MINAQRRTLLHAKELAARPRSDVVANIYVSRCDNAGEWCSDDFKRWKAEQKYPSDTLSFDDSDKGWLAYLRAHVGNLELLPAIVTHWERTATSPDVCKKHLGGYMAHELGVAEIRSFLDTAKTWEYAEDQVLKWEDVDWQKQLITVRHEVAKQTSRKTGNRRFTPMEAALLHWLGPYRKEEGLLIPLVDSAVRRRMKKLCLN